MKKILVALMLCSLVLCGMGYRDDASAEPVISEEFVMEEAAAEIEAAVDEVAAEIIEDVINEEPVEENPAEEIEEVEEPEIFDDTENSVILYEEDEYGQVWEIVVDNPDGVITEPEDYGAVNDGIEPCWSYNGLHAGCFVVIGVERDENDYDMVTIQATNGNIFQFYAYGSDWCVGDGCVCIMSDNGTPEIADDIILTAGYACF